MISKELSIQSLSEPIRNGVDVVLTIEERREAMEKFLGCENYNDGECGQEEIMVIREEDGSIRLGYSSDEIRQAENALEALQFQYTSQYEPDSTIAVSNEQEVAVGVPQKLTGDWLIQRIAEFKRN